MKVFISRQTKLPIKPKDYTTYTETWKKEFDNQFKLLSEEVKELKAVKTAKASKDKRLKAKAALATQKKYSLFNDHMDKYREDLNKKYKNKIELELDYKDFDLSKLLKSFPGHHIIGTEKKTNNILVVING